jgi:GLPGLI family protein
MEQMLLLIGNKYSCFLSLNRKDREQKMKDAAEKAIALGEPLDMRKIPKPRFSYMIYKEYPKDKITTYDIILGGAYTYEEDKDMFNWEIINETKEIAGYKCYNAETNFGGRTYIAWFTTDIPINDGPYKFNGLPGLIVDIKDTKDDYHFELTNFSKQKEKDYIVLSMFDYTKVAPCEFKEIRKNRLNNLRTIMQESEFKVSEGQMELSVENIKKNNNYIELK